MTVTVRLVEPGDENGWAELYAAYRSFYRLPDDPAAVAKTWKWVRDGEHGIVGLVAIDDDDAPVALANLRWFARPSSATIGLYVDDLFTVPAARGRGAASALLE
ncbi:MAG TPA: GNAT family N-acetyltransferase, partial [Microbacterium sp.]|nr:GNAT family N-acetyltransferase [Microbacterium sp.]